MKKVNLLLSLFFLAVTISSFSQTHMNISDNIDVNSNSWIIFNPGTYSVPDPGHDGLIRINNKKNIILDGANVNVDGQDYTGYMIKINNSSHIIIRNFQSASHFNYALYVTNSDSLQIYNCDFSYNKVDSTGWIDVWTDYTSALGGGVMMWQTKHVDIHDNVMKMQNDGVALYHCRHIAVWQNDFDWNTSYGIRMFYSDTNYIHHNLASHINRPFTDPSDCAAILMIVSNVNLVTYNNFSYSGDGIFLGQYQHSDIPNKNAFLYNECSFSPHNAIEATFADSNIYRSNICNYSEYGLWLGYSFNSLVDSNQVVGNQYSGIAIDRGYDNIISNNNISDNPNGIELWEGSSIPGYENQFSHDYLIYNNHIEGNRQAITSTNTEHMLLDNNEFVYNFDGVKLLQSSSQDTFTYNLFKNNTSYHINNLATDDIYAPLNTFFAPDEDFIDCKIYDSLDNPSRGRVNYHPFSYENPPIIVNEQLEDMAEPPAAWYAYPEVCGGYGGNVATTVNWDSTDVKEGAASMHGVTGNGWDIAFQFWPGGDSLIHWQLSEQDTLIFWLKTHNTSQYGFQYHQIRLGNHCGGYYKYTGSASVLNAANGAWKLIKMPLAGGGSPYNYVRTVVGTVSFDDISYVTIHADTWDYGFELWLDGMHFSSFGTGLAEDGNSGITLNCYPNPAEDQALITWTATETGPATLELFDMTGQMIYSRDVRSEPGKTGYYELTTRDIAPGIYLLSISSGNARLARKLIIR